MGACWDTQTRASREGEPTACKWRQRSQTAQQRLWNLRTGRGARSGYENKLRRKQPRCVAKARCFSDKTRALSISEHEVRDLDHLVANFEGMATWLSKAKLPGRNHLVRFPPVLSPGQGLVKQTAPGPHDSCRRLPLAAVLRRRHVLAECPKKTTRTDQKGGLSRRCQLDAMIRHWALPRRRTLPASRIRISTTAVPAERQWDFHGTALRTLLSMYYSIGGRGKVSVSLSGPARACCICIVYK